MKVAWGQNVGTNTLKYVIIRYLFSTQTHIIVCWASSLIYNWNGSHNWIFSLHVALSEQHKIRNILCVFVCVCVCVCVVLSLDYCNIWLMISLPWNVIDFKSHLRPLIYAYGFWVLYLTKFVTDSWRLSFLLFFHKISSNKQRILLKLCFLYTLGVILVPMSRQRVAMYLFAECLYAFLEYPIKLYIDTKVLTKEALLAISLIYYCTQLQVWIGLSLFIWKMTAM